ncbi:MAG: HAMP domain-containing sensor histidine kinase [Elusimicrobiota bacterium]
MRFANKVFLLAFLVAGILGFGVTWASRGYVKRQARDTYISKYFLLSESLGHALHQLEANAETLMYNAAKVVVMEDDRSGLLATERLKQYRDELNITHLFIINTDGNFVRSTNEDPKLIPNLYSFCPKYSELIAGGAGSMGTPIIPPTPEPKPYKFLTLPNTDRTRMIEVGLRVDFIGGILTKALQADTNIVHLNLYAPNGTSLGRFSKSDLDLTPEKATLPDRLPTTIETKDEYRFFAKIPSTQPRCCQCEVSGISKDGEYYYVLESKVSKAQLNAVFASIEKFFLFVAALSLFIACIAARIISRTLVRRLERVISGIREAKDSKLLGAQLEVTGNDEFAHLAVEFNELLSALGKAHTEILNVKREAAIGELALQVAHDIRSPLAALDATVGAVNKLPEEERLIIRSAVNRIKDIANHLLEKNRAQGDAKAQANAGNQDSQTIQTTSVLLSSFIEPLITEKRLQFRPQSGIEITANLDASSYGLFAKVEPREFKRVLSNLINNSVEALKEKGSVTVNLAGNGDWFLLKVKDNGPGIPPEILSKLGQRGQTHGKAGGSGLGLYHARTSLESWGGSLNLESRVGQGTSIAIKLPKATPPSWFVSELLLPIQSPVVILDDDPTIHQVWQGRLDSLRVDEQGIKVQHCSTPDELREWVKANQQTSATAIYLTDFELLGFKETGLSLVEELNLGPQAILVTSRYEEERVLKDCLRLGVRLIPKNLVGFVPIRIDGSWKMENGGREREVGGWQKGDGRSPHPALGAAPQAPQVPRALRTASPQAGRGIKKAVLIDDDKLVQMTWRMAAKGAGVELSSFSSPQDFEKAHSTIARDTPIYLDSSFPGDQKGEDFLPRLKELGFTQISMATGFEADSPKLKALGIPVIGKEPPFGSGS